MSEKTKDLLAILILGPICLALGLYCAYNIVSSTVQAIGLSTSGIKTTAEVGSLERESHRRTRRGVRIDTYVYLLRFDGYEVRHSRAESLSIGMTLPVVYDPGNPNNLLEGRGNDSFVSLLWNNYSGWTFVGTPLLMIAGLYFGIAAIIGFWNIMSGKESYESFRPKKLEGPPLLDKDQNRSE